MAKLSTPAKVAVVGGIGLGVYLLATAAKADTKKPTKKAVAPQVDPPPKPQPQPGKKKKPPGFPPPYGRDCYPPKFGGTNAYDDNFWDQGSTAEQRQRIFDAFTVFGYQTPADRDTMNALGPDGDLGGGDDVPNAEVKRFQSDYNAVSRAKNFVSNMGGLDEDGLVGPCTLNGLKLIMDNIDEDQTWPEIVAAS